MKAQGKIEKSCLRCGSAFFVFPYREAEAKYCSRECSRPRIPTISCEICGVEFKPSNKGGRFCSQACFGQSQAGRPAWNKGVRAADDERVQRCCDAAHESAKGRTPWNKNKKGVQTAWNKDKSITTNTGRTHWEKGREPWNKGKHLPELSGPNSCHWKGGPNTEEAAIRHSPEYRAWRKAVFERDNFTCYFCGERGGKLNADHIKSFSTHPELRLSLDNGRTLCFDCHKKTRTYGKILRGKIKNRALKRRIVELSYANKLAHLGSNLTSVDIIWKIFKAKAADERFYLSAGHYALALFVVLERLYGYDAEALLHDHGTHCKKDEARQIFCVSGSLGCVIGIAVGRALGARDKKVHCLISDGETAEGSVFEALRIKRDHKLRNLRVHINMNGLGAYRLIDTDQITKELLSIDKDIHIHHTTPHQLPFLTGVDAHYLVLTDENYKTAMELLK